MKTTITETITCNGCGGTGITAVESWSKRTNIVHGQTTVDCFNCGGTGTVVVEVDVTPSLNGLRNAWKTGKERVFQTQPHEIRDGVASVLLVDNADNTGHEADMPAQYIVTRTTCTCGERFCAHRGYVIAMNDKLNVDVMKVKTMAGGAVAAPVAMPRIVNAKAA